MDKSIFTRLIKKSISTFVLLFAVLFFNSNLYSQLIISQYTETETGSVPKAIELWNVSGAKIDFAATKLEISQGTNGAALVLIKTINTGVLAAGEVMVVGTADVKTSLDINGFNNVRFDVFTFTFNGNDALQISLGGVVTDKFGNPGQDPGSGGWLGNGIATANTNIELKFGITTGALAGFTDPSTRFGFIGPGTDLTGFGLTPGTLQSETPFEVLNKENFNSGTLNTWTGYSVSSNANWKNAEFALKRYAIMNGFGADGASDDWLISPQFNLSSYQNIKFSFSWRKAFTGPNLLVKVSTDYPGTGNPNNYNWTTIFTPSVAGWISSGELDLSAYDKPNVYIAFHYLTTGATTGLAAEYDVDDIYVKGSFKIGGEPSNLSFFKVNPTNPMVGVPFTYVVRPTDINGYPTILSSDINVTLQTMIGTGSFTGSITKLLKAGESKLVFDNLTYSKAEQIRIRATAVPSFPGEHLIGDGEILMKVSSTPTLQVVTYSKGHAGVNQAVTVNVLNSQGQVNGNYNNYDVTLTITGGTFTGTIIKKSLNGVATFTDIVLNDASVYTISASAFYLANSSNSTVNVIAIPTMADGIIPQYLKGDGAFLESGGTGRIPSLALVSFAGLHPNTVYRYNTGLSRTLNNNSSNLAGRNFVKLYNSSNYLFLGSNKNLAAEGNYSSFMSDGSGNAKVWVNVTPDATFDANSGYDVYWVVDLGNDAGNLIKRIYTTALSKTIQFGGAANQASGIYDDWSKMTPTNIVGLLDQNGKVITTCLVQNEGATLQTTGFLHQSPWFYEKLENVNGAWATFIPNNLPGGVRAVVEYDSKGNIIKQYTDDDGIWAGYNTISSAYGINPPLSGLVFQVPDMSIISPTTNKNLCNGSAPNTISWSSRGTSLVDIWVSQNNGTSWDLVAIDADARAQSYAWDIIRNKYRTSINKIRINDKEHNYNVVTSGDFYIYDTPEVYNNSETYIACLGENSQISVVADGSNLKYQWYRDGVKISDGDGITGTNTEILKFAGFKHSHSAVYQAFVSGSALCSDVQSGKIGVYTIRSMSVLYPSKDVDQSEILGQTATLNLDLHINGMRADNATIEKYGIRIQWYKKQTSGTDLMLDDKSPRISGSKSDYLSITPFTKADEGKYYAKIISLCNNEFTTSMINLIEANLKITTNPIDATICENTSATFEIATQTSVNEPILYTWFKDGSKLFNDGRISGANTNKLIINNVIATDAGKYSSSAVLKLSLFSALSTEASLLVTSLPAITTQPEATIKVEPTKAFTLSVVATGDALTYQWYLNGKAIDKATAATYSVTSAKVEDAGDYEVEINSTCGKIKSTKSVIVVSTTTTTSVSETEFHGYKLGAITPNPATNSSFGFTIPQNSFVTVKLYNESGLEITTLLESTLEIGDYTINVDVNTLKLSSGSYFYTLQSGNVSLTQKMIVVK